MGVRPSALPVLTVLTLLTAPAAPATAAPARKSAATGFQKPAEEHRLTEAPSTGAGDKLDQRSRSEAARPSNELESRHYFRTPPDALAAQAAEREQALLEKLLHDRESQIKLRRKESIDLLTRFVEREKRTAPEMADALLRLAELRWEIAREDYLLAFDRWQRSRKGRAPLPDYRKAVKLYDRLLAEHQDYERIDLVLYMKAFALTERGDVDGAQRLFARILSDFPESQFRPDAHMAIAEHVFNTNYDYAGALQSYDKVLGFPKSALYDLALFKSAWCLWRLDHKKKAAVRFREVLDIDRVRSGQGERKRLRALQDEALEYLIQVFTEDEKNRAADVRRFLEEIGGEKHIERVLRRLSATYFDQARYDAGIEAYTLLLSIDPASPRAPDYQLAIARGQMALDRFDESLAAYDTLAGTYGPGTTWAGQQTDPEAAGDVRRRNEEAIRQQGLLLHQRGQEDGRNQDLERAASFYRVYLKHFDDTEQSYALSFYLAEILFHRLKVYPEAGEMYLKAARKQPKGEHTKDALYNAIGAFEHVRETELDRCAEQVTCTETDNDRRFGEAIELYAELYPDDPDLPEIFFRQGRLYYERRVYDAAVKLFGELLERYPKSPYASQAGELILDSFNRAEDYANIEKWSRRLLSAPAFADAKSQKRLRGLILGAVFKSGEQLAEQKKHAEAADAFQRAADEFPKDPRAAKALYNAGRERQSDGDLEGADRAYSALIDRYPGSEEGALGAWEAAQMYESIALFKPAAGFYREYEAKFPKANKRADALYNAILLYLSAEEAKDAAELATRFTKNYPRDGSIDAVHFHLGRAHEMAGDQDLAERTYRGYLKRGKNLDRKVEAQTRLGKAQLAQDKRKPADKSFSAAVKLARKYRRKLNAGLYFAAEARFLQGDEALRDFNAVKIAGSPGGLADRLRDKAQKLARAAGLYAEVVEFGVAEWVTAALFKIGQSYEQFAAALNDAPVPEELNEEEQQVYRDQLSMFVVPIEERALEAYEGGYAKALELHIYNRWTHKLYEGLTRLNDVEHPPMREIGIGVREPTPWPEIPVLTGLVGASPAPAGNEPVTKAGTANPPAKDTKDTKDTKKGNKSLKKRKGKAR